MKGTSQGSVQSISLKVPFSKVNTQGNDTWRKMTNYLHGSTPKATLSPRNDGVGYRRKKPSRLASLEHGFYIPPVNKGLRTTRVQMPEPAVAAHSARKA